MFLKFLLCEDGAVTVDWVVLTAATVGLGLSSAAAVRTGVVSLGGDVETSLSGTEVASLESSFMLPLGNMSFANGERGAWNGGTVASPLEQLDEMLVLGPGEYAGMHFDVPAGASLAEIGFDLIGGDSLDSEAMTVYIDGEAVTLARGLYNGTMTFTSPDVPGISVRTETVTERTNLGGHPTATNWMESVTRVTISVDHPSTSVSLGLSSGANQHVGDEFFAVDNVDMAYR